VETTLEKLTGGSKDGEKKEKAARQEKKRRSLRAPTSWGRFYKRNSKRGGERRKEHSLVQKLR